MEVRTITYSPSPTFEAIHRDRPMIAAVRGPVGSGKSVGCVMFMLDVAIAQEPNADGVRKTRWVCIRNTYGELKATVIKTFQDWIPEEVCPIKWDAPIVGQMRIPHPDGRTVIDAEFFFLSMDRPKDIRKMLSLEMTGVWINEAQFLDLNIVNEAASRAVQARYPSGKDGGPTWCGLIMDTNSPDEDHWWHEFEFGQDDDGNPLKPVGWSFYEQPGALVEVSPGAPMSPDLQALIDAGYFRDYQGRRFVANPKAENVKNNKKGFDAWFDQLGGKTLNWVRSRICNRFATVATGKPVFIDHFNRDLHVAKDKLGPIKSLPIVIGMDFGLTPSAIIGQVTAFGQLRILDEVVATGMGIERFIDEQLAPLLNARYPGMMLIVNGVVIWGDPAGVGRSQADETTCYEVLERKGFQAEPAHTNNLMARLEGVRWWLSRLVGKGQPAFIISPHCRVLIKAFETGYQYKQLNVAGATKFTEQPDKNQYSHPSDACQYLCLGAMPERDRKQTINSNATRAAQRAADSVTGY
ncbi:TerL [Aeromonas media]|uniref:TerL n=1 Tax=Aeromonas media TaxID=651 RepID=UPI00148B2CEB|nr:TerL [Aeromonas media]QJT28392.1 TerL [Aeromonas media]